MNRITGIGSFVLALVLGVLVAPASGAVSIDHNTTDIWAVPESAILQAKANLHIAYGHTSHGSQIISGMGASNGAEFDAFMTNNGATPGLYLWNGGGSGGALDLRDTPFVGAYDLGNPDRYAWEVATRNYLAGHPECNVIIWSWCGQASTTLGDIDIYLNLMEGLITDYPAVNFVFMTGHLDGGGAEGLLNLANEHIRNHCITHDRILYDFADIESYDPEHLVNYMPLLCNDNCDYDGDGNGSRERNWALEWQATHIEGVDWWPSGAAHSQHLNGNLKGYAAWWLWAVLGGWGPCVEAPSGLTAEAHPQSQEIVLNWVDNSTTTNEDSFIIQRQVNGAAWDNDYATVGQDVTTFTNSGLGLGTYGYRVVAHLNDDGSGNPCNSAPSNVAVAEMTNPFLPTAPTNLVATGDSQAGTIALAWTDNAGNEDEFIIQRRVDGGAWVDNYDTVPADVTTYLDDNHGAGPLPDGTYTYRVVASNAYGQSNASNEASAVISRTVPNTPSNLTSQLDGNDIVLTWVDESSNEESFVLERAVDAGDFEVLATLPPDTETYRDEGLAPAHTYIYRVKARNNWGDSGYSNETSQYVPQELFTLTLKQSVAGYEGCRDAYLDAANPTYNYGGDQYNYVRNDPKQNFIISFDIPTAVQGMLVVEARIGFYCWTVSSWQADTYLDLYRITEAWVEGTGDGSYQPGCVSWQARSGDAGGDILWTVPGGTHAEELLAQSLIPNAAYYPEFDITALVQEWSNGSTENLGVILKNDSPTITGIKASEYSEYGRPYLTITYTYPSSVPTPEAPALAERGWRLLPAWPNPARPTTAVRFELAESRSVELSIFSLDGRRVATLLQGPVSAGLHEVTWRGVDDRGIALDAGVYFARLRSGEAGEARKILLAR
jgi:hypothetical protein